MNGEDLGSVRWSVPVLIGLTLLVLVLTVLGAAFAFAGPVADMPSDIMPIVQTAILALQYALPIGLVAVLGRARKTRFAETVIMRRFGLLEGIGLAIGIAAFARWLNFIYSIVIVMLGVDASGVPDVTQLFPETVPGVVAVVVLTVVIAPLAEEIMFRGVLYSGLRDRFNPWVAGIVSAIVFTAFHYEPIVFVPILALGLMLAWLTERTRSVWPAIMAHAAFNASAVVLLYLLKLVPGVEL